MAGISIPNHVTHADGLRPVNLQTDLGDLADLIEAAFSSTMDTGGRAAIREMRQLSRLGMGLGVLSHLNNLAQGMSLGYVWVVDGRVIGNVSVYPADYPRDLGKAWIIANVAVYPEFRGQGIATQLMRASLDMIRQRSGGQAILQVDLENHNARHLYRKLGFVDERVWSQWHRTRIHTPLDVDAVPDHSLRITQRRLGDMHHELALAQMVRPQGRGGLDWLRPTHAATFRLSLAKRLNNWLNLRSIHRLVVRRPHADDLLGWLQMESVMGMTNRQLLLMTHPDYTEVCTHALIGSIVRRYLAEGLVLNHPHDDNLTAQILRYYHFTPRRTVVHMRCQF